MEQCSIREAALKLQHWFSVTQAETKRQEKNISAQGLALAPVQAAVNQPLGFELTGIDHRHPYLAGRDIDPETAEYFGVGFFSGKGAMAGHIVIPIHNENGELVAYAGRSVNGDEPKYRLPAGFHKSLELYNLHRAKLCGPDEVFLVEGFFDAMRLHQAGFPNVVAAMGCDLSAAQANILSRHFGHVSVMFDEDAAGIDGTFDAILTLAHDVYVTSICLPLDRKQPDEMSQQEVKALLRGHDAPGQPPRRPFFGTQRIQ